MSWDKQATASKTVLICSIVFAFGAVAGLLWSTRHLFPLLCGALLLAVAFNRLAGMFGSLLPDATPRSTRVGIVIGTLMLIAFAFVFVFANSASEQVVGLADRVDASVEEVLRSAREQPLVKRYLGDDAKVTSLMPSSAKSLGLAKTFFATTFGGLTDFLILTILSLYFSVSPGKYRSGAIRLVPVPWREGFSCLLIDSADTLWRWLLGRMLAMAIVGVLFGAGLAMIGVPMPVELGIFAALMTFIPTIGGIAAVIPALLLASQQGSTSAISVLALYLVIQFFESYLVTPMVQEQQVDLPPAMVILAQIVAGILFGFWGVVFATPMFAVALLWVKGLYVESWLEQPAT